MCALSDPSDDVTDFFLAYRSRSYRLFIKFARPIVSAVVSYKYNYFFITMSSGDLRSQARTYARENIRGTKKHNFNAHDAGMNPTMDASMFG